MSGIYSSAINTLNLLTNSVSRVQINTSSVSSVLPLTVTDSTASSSTTTGALVVTGGVGVGGTTNIGGNISVAGYINGNSTNTFIANQNNNQNVGNATYTLVNQYTQILTNASLYSYSAGVVTVLRAGTYYINALFVFSGYGVDNGSNGSIIQIRKNGSAVYQNYAPPDVITGVWLNANTVVPLVANDQISVYVWQNSGSTQTLLLATPTITNLNIVKLL